jgi:hypothetical protein
MSRYRFHAGCLPQRDEQRPAIAPRTNTAIRMPPVDFICAICRKRYKVEVNWRVEFLDDGVAAALSAFPIDIRARFEWIVSLIETHGLERMHEAYVKHLEGPV